MTGRSEDPSLTLIGFVTGLIVGAFVGGGIGVALAHWGWM